jgi:hypothetical protein
MKEFIYKITDYIPSEFDLIKFQLFSSALFEEATFLISYQKKSGIFQQKPGFEELKYDSSNGCGVLYLLSGPELQSKQVKKTFGNESILFEKGWL